MIHEKMLHESTGLRARLGRLTHVRPSTPPDRTVRIAQLARACDVMSRDLAIVDADAPVAVAAATMRQRSIGMLLVVDAGHLAGVVTDRDIVVRCLATRLDPQSTLVRQVMTPRVHAVRTHTGIRATAALMSREQIRRAVVLDDEGRAAGVVAFSDLVDRLTAEGTDLAAEALARVSRP